MTSPRHTTAAPPHHDGEEPRTIGELGLDIADAVRSSFTAAAAADGLTFTEARTLRLVAGLATQHDLVTTLGVAPSRVSLLVSNLEARGLVARCRARGDRRLRSVTVTPAGTAALDRLSAYLDQHSPLMSGLDEHERDQLHDLFVKMSRSLPAAGSA